jgi:hypothetical protein
LYGIAGGTPGNGFLPTVQNPTGSQYVFTGIYKTRLEALDPNNEPAQSSVYTEKGIKRLTLDFAHEQAYHAVQVGECTYVNGGILHEYDGASFYEAGFLLYPELDDPDVAVAGNIPVGDYFWRFYWEHKNFRGERLQSSYGGLISASPAGAAREASWDGSNELMPSLQYTHRDNVGLVGYRTDTGGGSYYRVSSLDPSATGDNKYIANDKTVDSLTFTDDDAVVTAQEYDYQNSGELDNLAPPSATILGGSKDRLFLAGGEVGHSTVMYSKLHTAGQPLTFNDALTIKVDRSGGEITGLATLNDSLVIFKESHIYIVTGNGPNNLGYGDSMFSEPQLVTADVGCKTQKSIVETPFGLMFQSEKGIYLIAHNATVSYIGAMVESYNDQTIKAATLLPDANQVIFLTDDGSTLMFDYHFKQWSTYTNHEGMGAVIWNGGYTYVDDSGYLFKQNDSFTDGGTAYRMKIRTAWIKFNQMQNYMRVREAMLIGKFHEDHSLSIKMGYDYRQDWLSTKTWSTADNLSRSELGWENATGTATEEGGSAGDLGDNPYLGGSANDVYQIRIFPGRQKCEAIRFEFSDNLDSSAGRAYEISELGLRVGIYQRQYPVSSARTV